VAGHENDRNPDIESRQLGLKIQSACARQPDVELPPGWHSREAVRRIRLVLAEIYCVYESGTARPSAFLHLDGDPIDELALALRDRATEIGVSFRDLWAKSSQHWAVDHNDFSRARWKTRRCFEHDVQ
jgi:hypothetical protein